MFNFWENISRYPRFFITAMMGLALIITSPLQNLLKSNKGIVLFTSGFITLGIILALIFKSMLDL